MNHDPQEDDPTLKILIAAADDEASATLASRGLRKGMGFCHVFWETKQAILLAKHGIKWRSPAQMNPNTRFD